ncbi:MAG TPA: DUF1223 domain-containing protein [Arsenicitalea sp.]|jgi:hypothetical protein|nr:DUF1223 domain-containing protein [Arsenicitalea sp.]
MAFSAQAGETKSGPKAVLELFTSEGCSSCPPADALLKTLGTRPDVIALAYHVDYWDYIGWTDTFGSQTYSDRQRAYSTAWGGNHIYTPQMVVNGSKGVVGSRENDVRAALGTAQLPLPVALVASDNMLEVNIDGRAGLPEATVWLVTYIEKAQVAVERGENSGKKIDYSNVVTGQQVLGMWEPASGAHLKLPLDQVLSGTSNGAVILVQQHKNGLPGPILGAASYQR